jgi:hypothetical protein
MTINGGGISPPLLQLHQNKEKDFSKELEGMCPSKLETVPRV